MLLSNTIQKFNRFFLRGSKAALLCILLSCISLSATAQERLDTSINSREREQTNGLAFIQPFTGSGVALSSAQYNYWIQYEDNERKYTKPKKNLEQKIYKKRWRNKELTYHFELVFHNLTKLSDQTFEREVRYQIEALNRDFGGKNEVKKDFYHNRLDTAGFTFSLATSGIVSNRSTTWANWNAAKEKKDGGSDPVQPKKYINIWVVDIPNSIGSYTQMPLGPNEYDGIVIDVDYFGTGTAPYNEGKTLTLLMGNYFGLYTLYNGGVCNDDQVNDTPIHHEAIRDCIEIPVNSSCDNRPLMISNFMSYAPDKCKTMFTKGQVDRMKHIIDHAEDRQSLIDNESSIK